MGDEHELCYFHKGKTVRSPKGACWHPLGSAIKMCTGEVDDLCPYLFKRNKHLNVSKEKKALYAELGRVYVRNGNFVVQDFNTLERLVDCFLTKSLKFKAEQSAENAELSEP